MRTSGVCARLIAAGVTCLSPAPATFCGEVKFKGASDKSGGAWGFLPLLGVRQDAGATTFAS